MKPDYQHGDIIYVDSTVAAVHGNDVVVLLSDCSEVLFKRLVVRRRRTYLRAINPTGRDATIPLPSRARILGVVVGRYSDK